MLPVAQDSEQRKKLLGKILKEMDLVTESQIQEALQIQKQEGGPIGSILVDLNYITSEELGRALAKQQGMEYVDLEVMELPEDVVDEISASIAQVYRVIPVRYENDALVVVLEDPSNLKTLDDLRFLLGREVKGAVADQEAIQEKMQMHYSSEEEVDDVMQELDEQLGDVGREMYEREEDESLDLTSLQEMANTAPVRKLLNLVLLQAIQDRASDIHMEPFEDEFKIRYRVDGVLYEMVPPPRHLHVAMTSRIKVMADLDIAERRLPQDGRIELNIGGTPVDLRVSCLPTVYGESVVMRVLDRRRVSLDIDKLGLRPDDMEKMKSLLNKPHGIVLVTGPTGCGKTTTLYAALNELNDVGVKILTAEDPVEYKIEGIMQTQVNPEIGVRFANSLRHFLRQDPDIVLVGEIRDLETAQIAVQASLTGHMVFSTVHTNDAPTAITRLVDLGLEPYLLTATLEAIIAQRLVRRICPNCREEYEPTADALMQLDLTPEDAEGKKFYRGRGCDMCDNIGYRGRMGIFEMMMMNEELRELVLQDASTQEIRECARKHGTRPLRESGLLAIYDGLTTIEEVAAVTLSESAGTM